MAALSSFGKSALRVTKNYSKGYSHTQIKVRNATCNDPWPPSGKEMYELAQMTYNPNDFVEIMEVIDKRLNDKGKNWRHVFKALLVLDYFLHSGSENVILYCEENLYEIKTLREFQYLDDEGVDQGVNVRHKAADITNLLMDRQRLRRERKARAHMRDRMSGRPSAESGTDDDESDVARPRRPLPNGLQRVVDREDDDLRRAIEESKRTAAQEHANAEDKDLERALKLSQEDEERRKRLVDQNAAALFDDTNQLPAPQTQSQFLIDASLPLQYATTGIQPQFTAIPAQYTSIQPQYTSFNPYAQQAQQEAMQAEYLRQQAEFAQQQLQAEQAAAQQAAFLQQQQQLQFQAQFQPDAQPLVPQPTAFGSNNPFAPQTPSEPSPPPRPASDTLATRGRVSFNLPGTYEDRRYKSTDNERARERERGRERDNAANSRDAALLRPFSTGSEPPRRRAGEREDARLASLFANRTGDGIDTFGNVGQLRFGQTSFGRVAAQKTGTDGRSDTSSPGQSQSHNPFLHPLSQEVGVQEQQQRQEAQDGSNLIEF